MFHIIKKMIYFYILLFGSSLICILKFEFCVLSLDRGLNLKFASLHNKIWK